MQILTKRTWEVYINKRQNKLYVKNTISDKEQCTLIKASVRPKRYNNCKHI